MNTELNAMMVQAECRFLNDPEIEKLREYARGMSARIATMRALEAAEDRIIEQAVERLAVTHAPYVNRVPNAREKMGRDMRLTLRYVAQAHVRKDMEFFRKSYASWIGQLLKSICPRDVLVTGQELLRDALEAHLDAADARQLRPYLDAFIDELRS